MRSGFDAVREAPEGVFAMSRSARRSIETETRYAPLPPDLAVLAAAGFAPGPLIHAVERGRRTGVAPLDALLASCLVPEDHTIHTLALGVGARVADETDFEGPSIDAETCAQALRSGLLRVAGASGQPTLYVAARGLHAARLALVARARGLRLPVALASTRTFADIVVARTGASLAAHASEGPSSVAPALSVRDGLPAIGVWGRGALLCLLAAGVVAAFSVEAVGAVVIGVTSVIFALLNLFRFNLALTPPPPAPPTRRAADHRLPVYTVLVPLAREASIIPALMDALERLDYPALGSKSTKRQSDFAASIF